ncbi:MAG: pyridoxal phosphate-dependent aminotransferase [Bacilli bacterium]
MDKQFRPHIASRAYLNEGDDKILSINAEAKEQIFQGKTVINASIGTLFNEAGLFSSLPIIDEALSTSLSTEGRSYPSVGGSHPFQEGVLKWLLLDRFDQITHEYYTKVVATPGGTGAITLALRNYTELNQSVLIPSPGWANYKAIISQSGAQPLMYPLYEGDHFNNEGIERLMIEVALKEERVFIVLNDPSHNPTGYTLSEDELDMFIASLNKVSVIGPVIVLFDIAYFDFSKEERSRLIFKKLASLDPNVLPLFAFSASKTFSIYGLRLGALVAFSHNEATIKTFEQVSLSVARAIWSCSNAHALQTLTLLLQDPIKRNTLHLELKKERSMLEKRGTLFTREAKEAGLKTFPYQSGFFITVWCPRANIVALELKTKGIFVLPINNEFLRIALSCITLEQTTGLAEKIHQAMQQQ